MHIIGWGNSIPAGEAKPEDFAEHASVTLAVFWV
jgi:hypothetical protein